MPDKRLSRRTAVVGVGTTAYGKLPDHDAFDLGAWALRNALDDCGLALADIDGLIVHRIPDYQRFGEIVGLNPRYASITPGQGRFSGHCIETAVAVIDAGLATTVALVYGNNGRSAGDRYGGATDLYGSGGAGFWFPWGMTSPGAFHALMAQRHMHLYGTTSDDFGEIAVTFRRHAALNPSAVMREPFTLEAYHASRWVVEPLHLLDYCLINDGGVAMIVTDADRARALPKPPIYICAFGQALQLADSTFPP
jgi:acetyl-CoA acetyltransferase